MRFRAFDFEVWNFRPVARAGRVSCHVHRPKSKKLKPRGPRSWSNLCCTDGCECLIPHGVSTSGQGKDPGEIGTLQTSNIRNRMPGTNCTENAVSWIGFRGVPELEQQQPLRAEVRGSAHAVKKCEHVLRSRGVAV
eukprot:272411-Rhodomonas_salina.2